MAERVADFTPARGGQITVLVTVVPEPDGVSSYRLVHSSLSSWVVTSKVFMGSLTLTTPSMTCSLSWGSQPIDRKVLPTAFGSPDCHSTRYGLGDHSPWRSRSPMSGHTFSGVALMVTV